MLHLLLIFGLFMFLALIISSVLSALSLEFSAETPFVWSGFLKLILKNLLLIISTVFALGLIATVIRMIF